MKYLAAHTTLNVQFKRVPVELEKSDIFSFPVLYMTGLREFKLAESERRLAEVRAALRELGGERRECSFVLTDVAGFTSMVEGMADPEKLTGIVNDYLEGMVSIAFEHDGTLDRIVGDAIAVLQQADARGLDARDYDAALREGILADLSPTILELMGLPQPPAMTGCGQAGPLFEGAWNWPLTRNASGAASTSATREGRSSLNRVSSPAAVSPTSKPSSRAS